MLIFYLFAVLLVSPILTVVVEGQFSKIRKRITSESGSSKGRCRKNYDTKLGRYRHEHCSIHFISVCLFIEAMEERRSELVVLLQVFGKETCERGKAKVHKHFCLVSS